jgi:site-specific DNA-methyltransferase (adenine-specific)
MLPSVDVICTDPPYGTGGWRRAASGQGGNPSGTLVAESWDDGAVDWLSLADPRAVLAFWPAARTLQLLTAATDRGLTKHRCLYMRKRDPKPMVADRTAWSVEPIWVLSRDGFVLHGGTDVLDVSTPRLHRDRDATGHPYQKPLEVMLWILGKVRAEAVVDPFVGSGTTLVAALMLGIPAIGIEQDEAWCEIAARRLQQDVLPLFDAAEVPA